ncbi:choline/ethanolamine kinase [Xylariaceae sp. FL0255]|nr:choline/ethanolamine kinase [Xylariaceae sp. FL0255]
MPSHTPNGVTSPQHSVRFIPLSYEPTDNDAEDSNKSARKLIQDLEPEWSEEDIEFVRFTDGITNTLLKATNQKQGLVEEQIDANAILLRAYGHGTDVLIDRQRETQNHELLMQYGLAPKLLARFNNGMMYRYIQGKVTQPADLRTRPVYLAVARRIAEWHATVPCISEASANGHAPTKVANGVNCVAPGKPAPNVWTVMQKWINALSTTPVDSSQPTKACHSAGLGDPRMEMAQLQKELDYLVDLLSQRPGLGKNGLVFAHCDLLSGNVIIEPKGPGTNGHNENGHNGCLESDSEKEEQLTVNFIDYEYATPSPAAFDLANHFSEWGGFDCDYNMMPTQAQRREFIKEYIYTYYSITTELGGGSNTKLDEKARKAEEQKLFDEIDLFRGLPGFYWGIWALIQARISQIDFNYTDYAKIRLDEYWAWKQSRSDGEKISLREKRWAQTE